MIPVTKPFMPPLAEYQRYVHEIWEREWLTNNGPLVRELESALRAYLGVDFVRFVTNGTIALQLAIKALGLKGEIITTPFSYVATTSAIVWEGCTPVFVDIDAESLNIDPQQIEDLVGPKTSAILATHVYGNPCDIEAIQTIAEAHGLKVIYDAAHAFGTTFKGRSLLEYGDISATSFHATKLFHTVEGGGVVTSDPELDERMSRMRNFGHSGPEHFDGIGINGKNSEFHAAMGLAVLPYADAIIKSRRAQSEFYDELLYEAPLRRPRIGSVAEYNFAYYPVLFESTDHLLASVRTMNASSVQPRRYFFPLLSELEYVSNRRPLPVATDIAARVLCLPMYFAMSADDQRTTCTSLKEGLLLAP